MAKIVINPIDGKKHLPGSFLCMHVTLCGHIDSFGEELPGGRLRSEEGIDDIGLPDCTGCIDTAREVFASITKKELTKLKL
jgi:hypothetical protein